MDVDKFLDLERRSGIKNDDIDDFLRKADEVDAAIRGLKDGTLDPNKEIKIAGIETPEEKAEKERQRQLRLKEQRRKAEELRLKRKTEEKERWWEGADLFATRPKEDDSIQADGTMAAIAEKERLLQRYTMDYSRWNDWTPTDEVSVQEQKDLEEAVEKKKNDEFEKNNPEFCNQFLEDMEERNKRQEKKRVDAEACRNKGNRYFKRKDLEQALHQYMESLKILPYEVKTLMNIAQVYIKQGVHEDAEEFLSRVLYLNPKHIKGLSRKAFILSERGHLDAAMQELDVALETADGATNDDLIAQMEDLRLLQREKQQEEALRNALPQAPRSEEDKGEAPTPTTTTAPPAAPAPAFASASAESARSNVLTDFEAASQVTVVINEVLAQLNSVKGGQGQVESFLDSSQHVQSVVDVMKRMTKNELLKVHVRKSGMLLTAVETVCTFSELVLESDEEETEKEKGAEARESFVAALLQLIAAAIEGERSAKLLLVDPLPGKATNSEGEGGTTTSSTTATTTTNRVLPLLRDLLCRVNHPETVYAATRVLLVCCEDSSSAKTRSWVFNDRKLLTNLATAIGELSSRHFTTEAALGLGLGLNSSSEDRGKNTASTTATNATINAFLITASDLIKTISFSANGQEHMTKFAQGSDGTASGAVLICALASALHCSILHTLAANVQSLLSAADGPDALLTVMRKMQEGQGFGAGTSDGDAAVALAEETCLVVLEALLGCSQVEPFRGHFSMDVPVATPGASGSSNSSSSSSSSGSGDAPTTMSCVHIILQAMKAIPGFTTTGLAVLMNASLDSSGAVRKAIVAADGTEEALAGLKTASSFSSSDTMNLKAMKARKGTDNADFLLLSRRLGLLSRVAPVTEVQTLLYTEDHYRNVLRALRACSGVDNEDGGGCEGLLELLSHLVRTLATLNQPPKALLKVAQEECLAETILHIFPEPRKELGKVTPESVILTPKEPASALLLGNAARCLMPLGDDLDGCALALYTDRKLIGIEKLICAMATCNDVRVRRNISILLAKGCRVKGVRELVTDFRGMQMMVELNKQM